MLLIVYVWGGIATPYCHLSTYIGTSGVQLLHDNAT